MACTKKKMAKGGMVAKKRQPGPVAPPPGYAIGGIVQERIDSGIGPNWTNTRGYARGGPVGVVGPYDRARAEDVGAIQGLVNLTPSLMNDPQTRQSLLDEKKAEAKQLASDMSSPMYRSGANLSQSQKQAAADEQAGWAARGAAIQSGVEAVGEAPAERSRRTSSKSGAPADLPGPSWAPSGAGPWQDVRDRSATDLSEPGSALSTLNQGGLSLGSLSSGIGQDQSPLGQYQRGGAAMDYRQGGPVAGGPPGVDTVPAMLNNGEYVLPRPTTQAMGGKPALDQAVLATTGKPPVGYAQGGMLAKM